LEGESQAVGRTPYIWAGGRGEYRLKPKIHSKFDRVGYSIYRCAKEMGGGSKGGVFLGTA